MSIKALFAIAFAIGAYHQALADELTLQNFQRTNVEDYDAAVLRYLNHVTPKIVGGTKAKEGVYTWQVSLDVAEIADVGDAHFCGGSIVATDWIVTAAHCVAGLRPEQVDVVAGTISLEGGIKRLLVDKIVAYREYRRGHHDFDIALVHLSTSLKLDAMTTIVPPLEKPEEDGLFVEGHRFAVTGWGATVEGGTVVRSLMEAPVPFVPTALCRDPLSYGDQITENMFCAGASKQDSCQGDSGGPLVNLEPSPVLVGIVSWGDGCGRPGKFGVYTRVSNFAGWLKSCTEASAC